MHPGDRGGGGYGDRDRYNDRDRGYGDRDGGRGGRGSGFFWGNGLIRSRARFLAFFRILSG